MVTWVEALRDALSIAAPTRRERIARAGRVAMCRMTLERVAEVLDEPFILLKGEPLASELYNDPFARSTSDVDVLIRPGFAMDAVDALERAGFRRVHPRLRPWAYNQFALYPPQGYALVEIHWRIALPHLDVPATEDLIARARHFALPHNDVLVLEPADLLIQLALHFQQHNGFTKGALDIAGWLDRYGSDSEIINAVKERSHRSGTWNTIQWPLYVIAALVGRQPPLYAPDSPVEVLVDSTITRIRDPQLHDLGKFGEFALQVISAWQCSDDAKRARRAVLGPILCGPHRVGNVLGPRVAPWVVGDANRLE